MIKHKFIVTLTEEENIEDVTKFLVKELLQDDILAQYPLKVTVFKLSDTQFEIRLSILQKELNTVLFDNRRHPLIDCNPLYFYISAKLIIDLVGLSNILQVFSRYREVLTSISAVMYYVLIVIYINSL